MRAGEEYSELVDLGGSSSSYTAATTAAAGGGGVGGGRYGPSGTSSYSRTPARGRSPMPAEAEDVLGPNGSPSRTHSRSRSGLYYSPPGTSYTIVERPSSVMHHHSSANYNTQHYNSLSSPRGALFCENFQNC